MSGILLREKSSKFERTKQIESFINLMKPRVMSLVLFTCTVGMLIAPEKVSLLNSLISLIAVGIGAGAAGVLNMWYESDLDAVMSRTCLRPIPTGKVKKEQALLFGVVLSVSSILILYFFSNLMSALLLTFTIFFYFFIYTVWLKRISSQNIVIGGAAGALPPVIGWSISTGEISMTSIILFLIIFLWTPSHFWALSIFKSKDYKAARIPMLVITSGVEFTKKNIFIYSILMIPTIIAPFYMGLLGLIFFIPSILMTFYYIYLCHKLLINKRKSNEIIYSKKVFAFSIIYLFLVFVLILLDNFIKF